MRTKWRTKCKLTTWLYNTFWGRSGESAKWPTCHHMDYMYLHFVEQIPATIIVVGQSNQPATIWIIYIYSCWTKWPVYHHMGYIYLLRSICLTTVITCSTTSDSSSVYHLVNVCYVYKTFLRTESCCDGIGSFFSHNRSYEQVTASWPCWTIWNRLAIELCNT